ncbi:uncharacterized protein LOC123319769 [Coccinella septempunctata]|uniref:uncharacterized protein LOC123319769 n=1 Tax=Coccinella septempunctata TaxID=41139 RepID=UPI001D080645|nr:uncharacterized protein LOC123319769 [Coccinella septempunctata]
MNRELAKSVQDLNTEIVQKYIKKASEAMSESAMSADSRPQSPTTSVKRRRITDSENPEFSHPKQRSRRNSLTRAKPHPVTLRNNYEQLPREEKDYSTGQTNRAIRKPKRPPPIVIQGIFKKHLNITITIRKIIQGKFLIRYSKNASNIYCDD